MKARIKLTATIVVDLNPDSYPEDINKDPENLLQYELEQMNEDPDIFWEVHDNKAEGIPVITGELIK